MYFSYPSFPKFHLLLLHGKRPGILITVFSSRSASVSLLGKKGRRFSVNCKLFDEYHSCTVISFAILCIDIRLCPSSIFNIFN